MWSFVEAARVPSRLLGELLVEDGLITADELEKALTAQAESGKRLGEVLVECRLVSGPELTAALMQQMGVEMSTQEGFGSGLFAEIKRRHRQARVVDAPLPERDYASFDDTPRSEEDNVVMLDRLVEADTAAPEQAQERKGPATMSETAAFAARLAEADDALMYESAYREKAERELEALLAGGPSASAPDRQVELDALGAQLSEARSTVEAQNAKIAELEALAARPDLKPELDKLVVELETARAAAEREATSRSQAESAVSELEAERESYRAELAELAARPDLQREVDALGAQLSEAIAGLEQALAAREQLERSVADRDASIADLENQLKALEARPPVSSDSELASAQQAQAALREELDSAAGRIAEAEARELEARARIGQLESKRERLRDEFEGTVVSLRAELDEITARLQDAEVREARALERLAEADAERDRAFAEAEETVVPLRRELEASAARLAEADARLADAEARLAERDAHLAERDAHLAETTASLVASGAIEAEARARIARLEEELGSAREEAARLNALVQAQTDDAQKLVGQIGELQEALTLEAGQRKAAESDLERLRADVAGREARFAEIERERADLEQQLAEITTELADERMKYVASEEDRAAAADALTRERLARERLDGELFDLRGELNRVVARLADAEAVAEAAATPAEETFADYVLFVPGETGYCLSEREGAAPEPGTTTEVDGIAFRVLKIGRSPLPEDRRRCVFLEAAA